MGDDGTKNCWGHVATFIEKLGELGCGLAPVWRRTN